MKMITIFKNVFTLLLTAQLTTGLIPPYTIRKCVETTKIQAVDIALFYGTDYLMVTTPAKCYFSCLFETSGFALDGKISEDVIYLAKNKEETEKFKKLIAACNKLESEGECESTYQAFRCWVTEGQL